MIRQVGLFLLTVTASALAQTTVTTAGGTTGTLPKFSGNSSLADSLIRESNGKVGVGVLSPVAPLDIGGYLHVSGDIDPSTAGQGGYFGWNAMTGGTGETDFINNRGGGAGGFAFMNTPASGSPRSTLMFLDSAGKLSANAFTGGSFFTRDATSDPNRNSTVDSRLLHEGMQAGDGSSALGWGLHIGAIPWTWSQDPIYYHGGAHIFKSAGPNAAEKEVMRINSDGSLNFVGSLHMASGSGASVTFPDNSVQSTAWNGTTGGGDYAESVDVSGNRKSYEPGDVIVIDVEMPGRFLKSSEPYSTAIAGIYSTKPGLTGRRQLTAKSEDEVPMAMMGIVPTKVSDENGPIKPGDFLVTSSRPGYAMKGTDRSRMFGAVVGKAMGHLESGNGVIEALVSLQ